MSCGKLFDWKEKSTQDPGSQHRNLGHPAMPVYNLPNGNNVSRKSPVEVKMQTLKIIVLGA
jgi:hypothetical protein